MDLPQIDTVSPVKRPIVEQVLCSTRGRMMTMSSIVNRMRGINFGDLQWKNKYSANSAYIQSKLANLIFALELDARNKSFGWGILSNAVHPDSTPQE